jgi:hypothetical protein
MSVAGQQQIILLEDGVNDNPRKIVLTNLAIEASDWWEQGDHQIIMDDFNEDVRMGEVKDSIIRGSKKTPKILMKQLQKKSERIRKPTTSRSTVVSFN